MSHTGIRLRVTTPGGVVLMLDSDDLAEYARYALAGGHPSAVAGDGWVNVWTVAPDPWLTVDVLPVDLPDDRERCAGFDPVAGPCARCYCAGCIRLDDPEAYCAAYNGRPA